jgi:hypothetical protein
MNRRPGILWIFLRVLLTAIGVFVAAAVVGWVAQLLSGRKKTRPVVDHPSDPLKVGTDDPGLGFPEADVVDVTFSEVEEVHR